MMCQNCGFILGFTKVTRWHNTHKEAMADIRHQCKSTFLLRCWNMSSSFSTIKMSRIWLWNAKNIQALPLLPLCGNIFELRSYQFSNKIYFYTCACIKYSLCSRCRQYFMGFIKLKIVPSLAQTVFMAAEE